MFSKIKAASYADLAMGPEVSCVDEIGIIPLLDESPTLILIPYNAARLEGQMIDPSVSLPSDAAAKPALTPIPDPEDDPHGSPPASNPPTTYADCDWPNRADQPLVMLPLKLAY